MIIDVHTHITAPGVSGFIKRLNNRQPFSAKTLLYRMDKEGIDKSILLPAENPELNNIYGIAGNFDCIREANRHKDRLLTFCSVDPRTMFNDARADLGKVIEAFKSEGCIGIGELCANLPIDHPLYQNLYYHAGECQMPLLFHIASQIGGQYGAADKLGLPGLAAMLSKYPKTIFIGHAPSFWNELDGDLLQAERNAYPKGEIKHKGVLWTLFSKYPNLYADLSAGSAFNALSRDPMKGYAFLDRYHDQLLFGTDRFTSRNEADPPILHFLRQGHEDGYLRKKAINSIHSVTAKNLFQI